MGARVFSMGSNFFIMGVIARKFNGAEFGVWALITSLNAILSNVDFGLGAALRNKLIIAKSSAEAYDSFIITFLLITFLSFLFLVATFIAHSNFNFTFLFQEAPESLLQAAVMGLLVALIVLLARLPFSLGMVCFYSYGEAKLNSYYETILAISLSLCIVLAVIFDFSLLNTIYLYYSIILAITVLSFGNFLNLRQWGISRINNLYSIEANLKWIWRNSFSFGLLQITASILNLSPTFLVGSIIGVEDAGIFRASMLVFWGMLTLYSAYLMPVWSRYSEMSKKNKRKGIWLIGKQTFYRTNILVITVILFVLTGPWMITIWLGRVEVSTGLLAALGVWVLLMAYGMLFSVYLNGVGKQLMSFYSILPSAVVLIPLCMCFAKLYGVNGIAYSLIVTSFMSLIFLIMCAYITFTNVKEI